MQKLLSVIAQHCPGPLADAARRQAATSLRRAEQALVLDQDKTCLRELHAELHGGAAEAAEGCRRGHARATHDGGGEWHIRRTTSASSAWA
jgi:hypothetical protein